MIDKILSISGRPGLYRLVKRGNNMLICESLADGHRIPALQRDRVLSLADIAMYSTDEEVPLNTVFRQAKELTGGKPAPVTPHDSADDQKAWFRQVFPTFDEDRVRASDIKKFIQWFNILIETGNDDFSEPEAEAAEAPADAQPAEAQPAAPAAEAAPSRKANSPRTEKTTATKASASKTAKAAGATQTAKTIARKAGNTKRG